MHMHYRKYLDEKNYEPYIGKIVFGRNNSDWGDLPGDHHWYKGTLKSIVLEPHSGKVGLFRKHFILDVEGRDIICKFAVEEV